MALTQEDLAQLISSQLDPAFDAHWDAEGNPSPEAVYELIGSPEEIEVGQMAAYIQWAAPGYKRPVTSDTAEDVVVIEETAAVVDETVIVDEVSTQADVVLSDVSDEDSINAEIAKAEKILADAQAKRNALIAKQDEIKANAPQITTQQCISDYLDRQKKSLEERAERIRFIAENRSTIGELLKTKSPIDMALLNRKRQ